MANDMPLAYQQLLEHTTAILQPAMHTNLNRSTLSHPSGLLGWSAGPVLPTALSQPLVEEVNGERETCYPLFNYPEIRGT